MRSRPVSAALALGAAVLFSSMDGRGQPAPTSPVSVRVDLPLCDDLPFALGPTIDLVRLELAAAGVTRTEPDGKDPSAAVAVLSLEVDPCRPDNDVVRMRWADATGKARATRALDLGDVAAAARPRALALAVGEFIRAQRSPPPPGPQAEPPAADQTLSARPAPSMPAAIPQSPASAPGGHTIFFVGEATLALFRGASDPLLGGRLGLGVVVGESRSFELEIDASYAAGTAERSLGDVSMRLAALGGGVSKTKRWRPLRVRVGPHGDVGRAYAEGRAAEAHVIGREAEVLVAFVGLRAGIDVGLTRYLRSTLGVEVAVPLLGFGAVAGDRRTAGLYGVRESVSLGLRSDF